MKDAFGNPLILGDRVLYSSRESSRLSQATIIKFTKGGSAVFDPATNTGFDSRKETGYLFKLTEKN